MNIQIEAKIAKEKKQKRHFQEKICQITKTSQFNKREFTQREFDTDKCRRNGEFNDIRFNIQIKAKIAKEKQTKKTFARENLSITKISQFNKRKFTQ